MARTLRASVPVILSLAYLCYVFRLADPIAWRSGLGDWQDPYFINALLEHWYRSIARLADPSSPLIYFPVRGTLGYSHGLVLFAPFYAALRLFLHPFHAHAFTLLLAIEAGALCLYALARRLGLSYVEALVATALFVSSRNVVHGETGVWIQRASVCMVPPILLLAHVSFRRREGTMRLVSAALAGLLAALLYVQDFYTAHFTLLFAGLFGLAWAIVDGGAIQRAGAAWRGSGLRMRLAIATVTAAAVWASVVFLSGGGEVVVWGARLRSRDWLRPALVALAGGAGLLVASPSTRASIRHHRTFPWAVAFSSGFAAGAAVFLWMYLGSYREHRGFPEPHLVSALFPRSGVAAALSGLDGYPAMRSFALVAILAALVWLPWCGRDRRLRIYGACALAISLVVLLVPFRFPGWSPWNALIRPLPGFGVIRDPKRIIQVYELAVSLALILLLRRLPAGSAPRTATIVLAAVVLLARPNPERFDYERSIAPYDRWVAARIAVAPECRSFYIGPASAEYMSRGRDMWSLYNVDAWFIALDTGIPTLNGYSAWFPRGWQLHDPSNAEYPARVARWIGAHHLTGVCELDIDARTMTPVR